MIPSTMCLHAVYATKRTNRPPGALLILHVAKIKFIRTGKKHVAKSFINSKSKNSLGIRCFPDLDVLDVFSVCRKMMCLTERFAPDEWRLDMGS